MSNVSFKGNIGKVRGLQFSNDGKPRFSFSVGESHGKFDKQTNAWTDTGTTWWNVTVFGREAEALAETIQEGAKQRVAVAGRAETREYDKSDGTKGQSLDCIADIVGIIPKAQQSGQQSSNTQQSSQQQGGFGGQQSGGWNAPAGGGGWGSPGDAPSF